MSEVIKIIIIPLILLAVAGAAKVFYDYRGGILVWLKRQKLNFLPCDFNIAFSINFKEGLNSGAYFRQIKNNLNDIIGQNNLRSTLIIKDFSDIKIFSDQEEAEKFAQAKDLNLIIWGNFSEDGLKVDNKLINKLNIKFTFGHPDDKRKSIGDMLLSDINSKLAVKNYWQIIDKDSYHDIEIVSNNLFDMAAYIIARVMKLSGRLNKSIILFESLYGRPTPEGNYFKQQIVPHLVGCYTVKIKEAIEKKNFLIGKEYCRKIFSLSQDSLPGLASLAYLQYSLGEISPAEQTVERLLYLYPRDPLTECDVAFFRILEKNYKSAAKHYDRLLSSPVLNFNVQETIMFLADEYDARREQALLYGSGVLAICLGNFELAKKDLKTFLRRAGREDYKVMYGRAKELLEGLKNKK